MKLRLLSFALAVVALAASSTAAAQAPSLDDVLKRAASYVAGFRRQLSGIVAEETYRQEVVNTGRSANTPAPHSRVLLKSDLLLIKPPHTDRYVELRDVFEVDGAPVRDRQARLEKLLKDDSAAAGDQIAKIIAESARHNIGSITRNVNTPLMPLQFLDASVQRRFRFKHVERAGAVFAEKRDATLNDEPVFRTTAEMWNVEYEEREKNTIIRKPDGDDLPARGRFWIDPDTGAVMISELIVDGGGVRATITVSYQSEPLMGFLVPVQMRESYLRQGGERITGEAQYARFRQIR